MVPYSGDMICGWASCRIFLFDLLPFERIPVGHDFRVRPPRVLVQHSRSRGKLYLLSVDRGSFLGVDVMCGGLGLGGGQECNGDDDTSTPLRGWWNPFVCEL